MQLWLKGRENTEIWHWHKYSEPLRSCGSSRLSKCYWTESLKLWSWNKSFRGGCDFHKNLSTVLETFLSNLVNCFLSSVTTVSSTFVRETWHQWCTMVGYDGTDPTPAKLWLHMLARLKIKNEKRGRWKTKKEKLISPLSFRKVEPLQHSQYPPLQWDRTGTHVKNVHTDLQL